jgi:Flp pilus assembly protein TadG
MSLLAQARLTAADEHGGVLVMFALFAPVAILLASFTIDLGNSFLHKRHLQVQADAGALAAAQAFQPCNDSSIYAAAGQYSGAASVTPPTGGSVTAPSPLYNTQIGGTTQANIHELINSPTYYNQPSPVDGTVNASAPCSAGMVDVKLTETNLPWYFKVANEALHGVPYINAHARVEVLQEKQGTGALPIAVNENAPRASKAYFIDESTGTVIATAPLIDKGPNAQGQEIFNNLGAPVSVAINHLHIGVRIALSGDPNNTTCPSTSQLVTCFDSTSDTTTLVHIQGWSNLGAGSLAAPIARQVTLSPTGGTCPDGYFSNNTSNCTFAISAKVVYGSSNTTGVSVTPVIGGMTGTPLTFSSGAWTGTATLPANSGANKIDLVVACKKSVSGSPCSGANTSATITDVQQTYSASLATSGSIQSAAIAEMIGGVPVSGADSFEVCETGNTGSSCTHSLVVNITTSGSLADAQRYSDPLYTMRFGSGTSASQTGAVQCPPGGQGGFKTSLISGCSGNYGPNALNLGWSCPDSNAPQDCIETDNGLKTGQLRQGMTTRVTEPAGGLHYYCPNNWINDNGGGVPAIPRDDSRVVQVFVTSYGSFVGSGASWFPIQTFANFYVTGWDGDPCLSDAAAGKDQVVGHFIKYVDTLNTSGGGTEKCVTEPTNLGTCVTVLTR